MWGIEGSPTSLGISYSTMYFMSPLSFWTSEKESHLLLFFFHSIFHSTAHHRNFLLLVSPPVYIAIWVFLPATPSFRKETSVCPLNSKFEHRFHVQIKLRQQTFYSVLSIIYIFNGHLLNIQGQEDH